MRKRILINGKKIHNREQLHTYLKLRFDLPEYYGKNLDALWDCMSHNSSIKKITVLHANHLIDMLGDYGTSLINLFIDLQKKNSIELLIYTKGRNYEAK